MKRITAFILILTTMIFIFTSCGQKTKNVSVIIADEISTENAIDISGSVSVPENANAGECIRQLCNLNDIEIVGVDEGFITSVGGVENEGDYAWMFYVNGELSDVGVSGYTPEPDDEIKLVYIDWSGLFSE